ncbi:25164_t:CDS:2, partial [Dentiscutata erythropus]
TLATMGVGLGFAIAAVRANLPMTIIIINNNGIYHGLDTESYNSTSLNALPSTALLPDVRYDLIADATGGKGYFVRKPQELENAMKEALKDNEKVIVINVMIQP